MMEWCKTVYLILLYLLTQNPVARLVFSIRSYFEDRINQRKLLTFLFLLGVWFSLLFGAILSPKRQKYTNDQLRTVRQFENGTGEIRLVQQTYSEENGLILLEFKTSDSTSVVDQGIDPKRLTWKLYAENKTSQTQMEVIPITDQKLSVLIRHVPKNFEAFAVDITNHTVDTRLLDVGISSSSDEDSKAKKEKAEGENEMQFFITTRNDELKRKKIASVSREEFTLSELGKEKDFQESQIEKLQKNIEQLKLSIEDDENRKKRLSLDGLYLVGDELAANQKASLSLETSIEQKIETIERAEENIEKVEMKIEALNRKIQDVKNGNFTFSSPIETIEMD
nr:hypothetical protein [Streptococcus sp. O1]